MSRINYRCLKYLCVVLASTMLYCADIGTAAPESADSVQAKAKLAGMRARIAALTSHLADELKERDAMSAQLRAAELVITATRQRLDALHTEQIAVERHRAQLHQEELREQNALEGQRAALAAQVRSAYIMGQQAQLKLLLNQNSAADLGRILVYYRYFAQASNSKIAAIQGQVQQLQQLVADIDQQNAHLKALQSDTNREMSDLEKARRGRADALASLSKQMANGNQQLADLKRQEQQTESLVTGLAQILQDLPLDDTQSFDHMRGKLPWPVSGRVTTHFQEAQANSASGVRWGGEMIEATRGAKVRAAYSGRVVYADWLQGLGLLLIIGHNGGYMTLYGHLEVLYKSVGDWVAPGDVIAALGEPQGAAPQLYFEIREGRKAVDPKLWLKANP